MAISVVMPALEMAQETGKLLAWRKKEGETVTKGEPLLEIETDKVVVDIEAPGDGILAGVKSHEGAVVPVGQTIAWIIAPGEEVPKDSGAPVLAARTMTDSQPRPAAAPAATASGAAPAAAGDGPRISPKARRIAQDKGVDIATITGTGPGGIITAEDVIAAAEAPKPVAAAPAASSELSSIARLMAERTTASWTQVPHFFLVREVDASAMVAARGKSAVKISQTDLLISLVAKVVAKHPKMNATWTGSGIQLNPNVNISVAMAVKDGVVGAVVPNAHTASLADISTQRKDLTERARAGKLRPADVMHGTFTISNLGMYGIDEFTAIITQPQAAVLAVGRIADRVVAVDGQPAVRPMMTMTLSSDHRVVDGAQAATFLGELAEALTDPSKYL